MASSMLQKPPSFHRSRLLVNVMRLLAEKVHWVLDGEVRLDFPAGKRRATLSLITWDGER